MELLRRLFLFVLVLVGHWDVTAFQAPRVITTPATTTSTSLNVFGNKKSAASKARDAEAESKYWQGEWVCKDCGYIYNRVSVDIEKRDF